jgi:hypothetical protein
MNRPWRAGRFARYVTDAAIEGYGSYPAFESGCSPGNEILDLHGLSPLSRTQLRLESRSIRPPGYA